MKRFAYRWCQDNPLRKGYYETVYGNTAVYKGGKTALDVDSKDRVPVELLERFIRPLERGE